MAGHAFNLFERTWFSYNGRHLAQEDHLKETKTTAELAKMKSTIRQANRFALEHYALTPHGRAVLRIGVMCVLTVARDQGEG